MKIFADKHHDSLTESLVLLFEKRLKGELYTPIGMEWFPDFWKLNDIEATAIQYLVSNSQPYPSFPPLKHDRPITFADFKKTQFDIIIATLPHHLEPFKKLIMQWQPQAKLIYQIGNTWNVDPNKVQNVMASANIQDVPKGINFVQYHQEFPLDVFYPVSRKPRKVIYSFINCLGVDNLFKEDWQLFLELERLMPDWEFKSYGGQCRNGYCNGREELAIKMRESAFGYQVKTDGDGFGHVIHNWARSGVPLIVRKRDYIGKLAEPFIEDGVTAITVDGKTPVQIANEINTIYKSPHTYMQMHKELANRFKRLVDFDKEEKEIVEFLGRLI